MPRIGLGAGLLATVLLAAGPLRGQNLLVNPGFDGGLDGWTPDAGASVVYGSRDATSQRAASRIASMFGPISTGGA